MMFQMVAPRSIFSIICIDTCIGVEHELGSVEVGKLADLILVEGDPATDIRDTNRIVWVIQGGKRYTRQDILENIQEFVAR
jgi:cytosine/adenosine deaminase-related metal-dependent hydrolase